MADAGGVNAAVPVGRAVPIGLFGVKVNVPAPAEAVVPTVMTPVAGVITSVATFLVAVKAGKPKL